jgi:alkyl sulfatase BDS1-like metallo-beta-lactamase superfamily hydrolase
MRLFTPEYWGDYETQLRDFYMPQANEQYARAMGTLRNQLGGAQGSAQRQLINDLKREQSRAVDTIEAQIMREVAEDQARISGKKADLTSTINMSSDPGNAIGDIGSLTQGLALPRLRLLWIPDLVGW